VPTTVVNQRKSLRRKFFAGRNPGGHAPGIWGPIPERIRRWEIIGGGEGHQVHEYLRDEIPIQAYIPYMNSPYLGGMTIYVRTVGDPSQVDYVYSREGCGR